MILVIQFRTDISGPHEVSCIYEAGNIPYNAYSFLNVNDGDVDKEEIAHFADKSEAIILGGMGEGGYKASSKEEREALSKIKDKMFPLIKRWIEDEKYVIGMCFGHQLIGNALGSEVGQPDSDKETGIVEVSLTEEGAKDPLLEDFGGSLDAVVGHKSSLMSLPGGTTHLAYSEKHEFQAFKINNVYGFQFHPELNYQDLMDRLEMYPEYTADSVEYEKPEELRAKEILQNFIQEAFEGEPPYSL